VTGVVKPVLIKVNICQFAFILGNFLFKNIRSSPEMRTASANLPILVLDPKPFPEPLLVQASLLSSIHPVLLSILSSIHPLYRVVASSMMDCNDKEDETAIIVATAVVAILYTTVPEKEKHVASVFDQRLCIVASLLIMYA
jgi:hypothetical protein